MKIRSRFTLLIFLVLLFEINPVLAQWVQTNGPYGGIIYSFAVGPSGTNLFAGTFGGVFLSTDNGSSWTAVNTGLMDPFVDALAVSGPNLFAGTGGGVFLSTNNGSSWTAVNNGLTSTFVRAFAVSDTSLFAGTSGGGVWRRPLSEMITSVRGTAGNGPPSEYMLGQNYPNPFNPTTSIQYAISSRQFVTLRIYDVLGNEIATLVNEEKAAGSYEVEFQSAVGGRQLASGIYFYKLQASDFTQIKKMILLK